MAPLISEYAGSTFPENLNPAAVYVKVKSGYSNVVVVEGMPIAP
jgi:hypothetical protein